jgi:hypothetical protein
MKQIKRRKIRGVFDERTLNYLKMTTEEKNRNYTPQSQRVKNCLIRKYARKAIEDLTLFAEVSNEKDLGKTFNAKTMSPLLLELFKIKITTMEEKYSKEMKAKRQRLFSLSKTLFNIFAEGQFVSNILPITAKIGKNVEYLKCLYDYDTDGSIT